MGHERTEEFRKGAVRIVLISGLTCKQIDDDLDVGMSTLNKLITAHRGRDVETFFKPINAELIWRQPWETPRQA